MDAPRHSATLEAVPERARKRRAVRASAAGPPEHDDELLLGARRLSPSTPRSLPRVLTGVNALVVDDDEDTVDLFAAALGACGAAVVTATSAAEALRIVAARALHVVVTDIAMPGADGYWLLREIRQLAEPTARALPVVAVTAFGREHGRGQTMTAGFADHLEKPVEPDVLCAVVARAAGR